MQQGYDTLTSVRDSKTNQIQNFFTERIGDINVLVATANVRNLLSDLNFLDMPIYFRELTI